MAKATAMVANNMIAIIDILKIVVITTLRAQKIETVPLLSPPHPYLLSIKHSIPKGILTLATITIRHIHTTSCS